nr:transposase [Sphingobium terrigena]|tara:strand:- start:7602 stop:8756 length:1155 start_codon:yes stop_codon:yes gene_type:complete
MMGRQVAQGALFYGFRPDDHVPAGHLLRRIDGLLDFAFVREALAASYSTSGRPSIDPELMLRMLLVGYLFGIRSERRLCEEVHLNLAYRWFCRLDLADRVPDHSTFSKNRHGRFRACDLHRLLFEQVVARCAAAGLVAGRELAVDGSTIVADTSRERRLKGADAADELRARDTVSRPVAEYLAALDAALPPGPDEPAPVEPASISPTDPQAALTCKHGPARYAYAKPVARPRDRLHPRRGGDARPLRSRGGGDPNAGVKRRHQAGHRTRQSLGRQGVWWRSAAWLADRPEHHAIHPGHRPDPSAGRLLHPGCLPLRPGSGCLPLSGGQAARLLRHQPSAAPVPRRPFSTVSNGCSLSAPAAFDPCGPKGGPAAKSPRAVIPIST